MKFKIECTSGYLEKYASILEKYNLEQKRIIKKNPYIQNEILSDLFYFIEINTLEELIDLRKKIDQEIILSEDDELEIYDSWRE